MPALEKIPLYIVCSKSIYVILGAFGSDAMPCNIFAADSQGSLRFPGLYPSSLASHFILALHSWRGRL